MDECLTYLRKAVTDPLSVPPWSEWWAANAELVEQSFPRPDFLQLKHRRVRGARELLQRRGELPEDYVITSPLLSWSCAECGERTTVHPYGRVSCPTCGIICTFHLGPKNTE